MKTLLLVDDDDAIREVAQLSLEAVAGWHVHTAPDGPTGISQAARHHLDAILLDVMMPGMDGPTTARHLRTDPATSHTPILLLTAKTQIHEPPDWAALKITGIIAKPFNPLHLPTQIANLLGWTT